MNIDWSKFSSGKFLSVIMIIFTYCSIMWLMTWTAHSLLYKGGESANLGKEIMIFIIGNFTGTAVGAVMAYFFKQNGKGGDQK